MNKIIAIEERPPFRQSFFLSLQHLFAMFGASVLIPTLFHIDPSIVLLMNGVGTILYIVCCKGKIPAFLGSSFAFISPVLAILAGQQAKGVAHEQAFAMALGGFVVVGLIFLLISLLILRFGSDWIDKILPPASMGPIVALIGLELSPVAAEMSGFTDHNLQSIFVALFTLSIVVMGSLFFRGVLSTIPILIGIISGYLLSCSLGMVDYSLLSDSSLFKWPHITTPVFNIEAILIILPATLVVISEHIGHLFVTGNIVGRDLAKKPGLHLSLAGNGLGTILSAFVGSVPTTTYGENIGVMAITRVFSVWVIGGAGLLSIILAFSGTISALIQGVPIAVMGGVSLLLFGVITASGIRMMVEAKIDYNDPYNLIMTALTFVIGISGISFQLGHIPLKGMGLATIMALLINGSYLLLKKLGQFANRRHIP